MSVLVPKEENNSASKSSARERSPRSKSISKQSNRDSLHLVNEKSSSNLHTEQDDDSESENLSPLLQSKGKRNGGKPGQLASMPAVVSQQNPIALHIDGIDESIDDTDIEHDVSQS